MRKGQQLAFSRSFRHPMVIVVVITIGVASLSLFSIVQAQFGGGFGGPAGGGFGGGGLGGGFGGPPGGGLGGGFGGPPGGGLGGGFGGPPGGGFGGGGLGGGFGGPPGGGFGGGLGGLGGGGFPGGGLGGGGFPGGGLGGGGFPGGGLGGGGFPGGGLGGGGFPGGGLGGGGGFPGGGIGGGLQNLLGNAVGGLANGLGGGGIRLFDADGAGDVPVTAFSLPNNAIRPAQTFSSALKHRSQPTIKPFAADDSSQTSEKQPREKIYIPASPMTTNPQFRATGSVAAVLSPSVSSTDLMSSPRLDLSPADQQTRPYLADSMQVTARLERLQLPSGSADTMMTTNTYVLFVKVKTPPQLTQTPANGKSRNYWLQWVSMHILSPGAGLQPARGPFSKTAAPHIHLLRRAAGMTNNADEIEPVWVSEPFIIDESHHMARIALTWQLSAPTDQNGDLVPLRDYAVYNAVWSTPTFVYMRDDDQDVANIQNAGHIHPNEQKVTDPVMYSNVSPPPEAPASDMRGYITGLWSSNKQCVSSNSCCCLHPEKPITVLLPEDLAYYPNQFQNPAKVKNSASSDQQQKQQQAQAQPQQPQPQQQPSTIQTTSGSLPRQTQHPTSTPIPHPSDLAFPANFFDSQPSDDFTDFSWDADEVDDDDSDWYDPEAHKGEKASGLSAQFLPPFKTNQFGRPSFQTFATDSASNVPPPARIFVQAFMDNHRSCLGMELISGFCDLDMSTQQGVCSFGGIEMHAGLNANRELVVSNPFFDQCQSTAVKQN